MTRVSSALVAHPRRVTQEPRFLGGAGRIESGKGVLIGDSVMVGPVQEVAASRLGPQATGESGVMFLSPYRVIFAGPLAASLQWCRASDRGGQGEGVSGCQQVRVCPGPHYYANEKAVG